MSSDSRPSGAKSKPSVLDQAPKLTPPTSSRTSTSPSRKPLQERSRAQTNSYSGPTIRIVDEAEDDVYLKFPIPSQPSQVLLPRHAPGYGFERPGSRVSSGSQVASTVAKFEAGHSQVPQPILQGLQRKKKFRHSASTRTSDADTLVASSFSPSSVRFSQGSTPPSSPPPELASFEKDLEEIQESSPSRPERPTIRAVPPSSSGGESVESRTRALTPEASDAALAQTVSANPSTPVSNAGSQQPGTSIIQSASTGHKHTSSAESEAAGSTFVNDIDHPQPTLKPSVESFAYSDISCTSIEPSYTRPIPTIHEARASSPGSGPRVSYPIVRVPSASSLRAQSLNTPSIASRMQDRYLAHQWSSQLSTIASVSERDSRSMGRRSRSISAISPSEESFFEGGRAYSNRRRGQTVGSLQSSSDDVSSEGHTEYSALPRPLFSPVSRSSSEERDDNSEHLDTISPLPSTVPLRMKSSGYLRRHPSDAGSSRSATDSRPGSSQSDLSTFIHNNIPAWARVYYRRGERISIGPSDSDSSGSVRLGTSHSGRSHTPSESNYPFGIYRPRNRPYNNRTSQQDNISLVDEIQPIGGDVYILGPDMRPLSGWSTPHLGHDQRGRMLYSAWQAPSLDSDFNTSLFGRRNRQILLFCLGFIFPLAWIIASFLPLPEPSSYIFSASEADLEQQFAQRVGPIDDKAFQKATWWRNLNRIMAGIGTLLIGVIITLAVLVSRMPTRT